jgi:pimeloyl-ACP methyl ester carboxylesterase
MPETLVHVETEDGFTLAGCRFDPESGQSDATVVWLHGLNLGFSEPEYIRIGRLAAERGLRFVTAETRGRGFGTWLRGAAGTRLAGSAWELLTESPCDVAAWIAYARQVGTERLVLAGHGWGAAKIVFHISARGSDGIDGVAVASSGSLVRDNLDPTLADAAARAVAEGRGLDLMPFGSRAGLGPNTVSAQVYAMRARVHRELYGAADMPPALARVDVPILAWFGDGEQSADRDVRGFLATIRRNAVASPRVETAMLGGASYLYTGAEGVVADTLATWVRSLAVPGARRRARRA